MGSYSSSEATRLAFIMAAGELFAEHGAKAVSVRAIAKKAGENVGNIHYHFGGKDGLFDAVLAYAMQPWAEDPFGRLVRENANLLSCRDGQALLVSMMIDLYFKIILENDRPYWCGALMFQMLQHELPVSKAIFEKCAQPIFENFFSVYKRITGSDDIEMAVCWLSTITAPAHLFSISPRTLKRIHRINPQAESLKEKLRAMTCKCALLNVGLDCQAAAGVELKKGMDL